MLKLLTIGLIGTFASVGGVWLNQVMAQRADAHEKITLTENIPLQLKTEMTGIPVVQNGQVSGYIVFQISSTVDKAKLPVRDLNVAPYILDSAIRASYQSTDNGVLEFDADYIERLAGLIQLEANRKLNAEAVSAVNIEQFNFVPKSEIRGSALSGAHE
jgi:hypothetical protein